LTSVFNPDLEVHLMKRPLKDIGGPQWNKRLTRLVALGVASRESGKE